MKLRILSDLHFGINKELSFSIADREVFTVLCGDISANTTHAVEWIDDNLKQGVFVEGNHICYDSRHSIQYIENTLKDLYPLTAPVSYLKNAYRIIDDIVFVGSILWTDFELDGTGYAFSNTCNAERRLV